MKVNDLKIDNYSTGESRVTLWCECHSIDDIVDIIAWLKLAKQVMEGWAEVRGDNGKE